MAPSSPSIGKRPTGSGADDVGREQSLRRVDARSEGGREGPGRLDAAGDGGEEHLEVGRPRRRRGRGAPSGRAPTTARRRSRAGRPRCTAATCSRPEGGAREAGASRAGGGAGGPEAGWPTSASASPADQRENTSASPSDEPQGLRAQRAAEEDMGVLVEEGLARIVGIGADAGRDVVAVRTRLEIALDLLDAAPVEGPERRERALVAEGDDDGRRVDVSRAAAEDGGQHAPEALEVHRHGARLLRRRIAEHLEVRGADAHPVFRRARKARGRRGRGGGRGRRTTVGPVTDKRSWRSRS